VPLPTVFDPSLVSTEVSLRPGMAILDSCAAVSTCELNQLSGGQTLEDEASSSSSSLLLLLSWLPTTGVSSGLVEALKSTVPLPNAAVPSLVTAGLSFKPGIASFDTET